MIFKYLLLTFLYVLSIHGKAEGAGFTVSGTKILDATGAPFIMRGINYAHTWFKSDLEKAIPAIAATNANIVRVVLSNGVVWDKDDSATVEKIISLLSAHKIVTMFEVHDAIGLDDADSLELAVDYWIQLKPVLQGKEDRVIVNIANEWYTKDNAKEWGAAYIQAVQRLRQAGFTHLIVIDSPGWGQLPDVIPVAGPEIFKEDSLKNTVFAIHMYEVAGKDAATIKKNIDAALAINVPVIVGEFAISNNGQPVDMDSVMSYAQQTSVGWLAWSWYGNNDNALDIATGPTGSLTAYGDKVVNGPNGLKATAVPAKSF